jgi:hypothetical protein
MDIDVYEMSNHMGTFEVYLKSEVDEILLNEWISVEDKLPDHGDKRMKNIKTKVVHSQSKTAWNIIGTIPGGKYKIARIPYLIIDDSEIFNTKAKNEALEHAQFISNAFNSAPK